MSHLPAWARLRRPPPDQPPSDDRLTRELRALYAPPGDGYWDDLEARLVAAVRAEASAARRAVTAPDAWWQALARWSQPGLAAAAVVLAVVAAVHLQERANRSVAARSEVFARPLGAPVPAAGLPVESLDPELAGGRDVLPGDSALRPEARAARDAGELLESGVAKRRPLPPTLDLTGPAPERVTPDPDAQLRARREATFRFVIPD
jgi:hypothetical protein